MLNNIRCRAERNRIRSRTARTVESSGVQFMSSSRAIQRAITWTHLRNRRLGSAPIHFPTQ
jgi:hypothetical protein